jgi:phosphatidylglycerol lysyltransferase
MAPSVPKGSRTPEVPHEAGADGFRTIEDRPRIDNEPPGAPGAGALSRAGAIVAAHGRSSLDHWKLLPGRERFFARTGEAFLAYRCSLGVAVVLGDPVGPPGEIAPLVGEFLAAFERPGRAVAFLQAGAEHLPLYRALGLSPVRAGATAIVDLAAFDLALPRYARLRGSLRLAARAGLRVRHLSPPHDAATLDQLARTNDAWRRIPGRFERAFTVGRFDARAIRGCPVSIVEDAEGRVAAFANWVPSFVPGEATVDLIRRRDDAPPGSTDALVAGVLGEARAGGFTRFDLGLVPLAGLDCFTPEHPAERVLAWTAALPDPITRHRGLLRWKSKFRPTWEPRWLVYRGGPLQFARVVWAVRRTARSGAR